MTSKFLNNSTQFISPQYISRADKSTYVSGVGPSFGLYLHLRAEEDQYVSSLKHSLGIDVSIHENKQYPDMSIYSTTIRPGNDVSLSVKPEITESEKNVKDTPINTRGCAFADEIKMEWSNSYSYTTCMNECKAKEIKKLCGCIPYYFYHIRGRSRFCTLPDLACIKRNNVKIKTSKITYNNYLRGILANTFNTQTSDYTTKCKCYPQCDEISYSYQQDQQPLQTSNVGLGSNVSILRVYFGHVSCMKLLRSVLITWELIVASVGGLVGLCLGGSILSVIEFFYHVMEALFSRYTRKLAVAENKKYKPKLYLTDFVRTKNVEAFKVVKCDCRKDN
ncbi:sodium channel protein Nach-like isoform X1 [Tenebrio molitor]|uniref:sodium channel protein Nach-like isoform X1 n=1 Tax=Tenebrio molitor TaxID=7067 RepID=UPI0036249982